MTKEELIQELTESAEAIEEYEGSYGYMFDAIADMVKDSDLVEIIRCKDCRYRYTDGDNVKYNLCLLNHNKLQSDEWFCADGERSEDE